MQNGRDDRRIWVSGFDAETWNNLCMYCMRRFGSVRGHIGEVMSEAVTNYLRDSYASNIIPKQQRTDVETTFRTLVEQLIRAEVLEITEPDLFDLIAGMGKSDRRTQRRYFNMLLEILRYPHHCAPQLPSDLLLNGRRSLHRQGRE